MSDALRQFKSEIFQGLANPTRIAMVELLRDGELSAGKLIEKLGIEQANASQHLRCKYAQHHSRPRTPARRVDRDPCAGPGD
jgi:DNA-binding transcriptional ArsR family regulator